MTKINNQISAQTEAELIGFIEELTGCAGRQHPSNLANGIYCVTYLPNITVTDATYDEDGNVLTEAILSDRFHADILADRELDLPKGITRHNPEHPKHGFT